MWRIEKKGGERVKTGTYWNVSNGERVRMERPGRLPGDSDQGYLRFHPLALLVLGPILGLVYAIFMPLVAILMVLWTLGGKILEAFAGSLGRVAGLHPRRRGLGAAAVRVANPAWEEAKAAAKTEETETPDPERL